MMSLPRYEKIMFKMAERKGKGLGKSSNLISLENEYLMAQKPQTEVVSCIRKACRNILSMSPMYTSYDSCDSFSKFDSDFSSSSISSVRVSSSRSFSEIFDSVDSTDFELKNISADRFIHEMAMDVLTAISQSDEPFLNFINNDKLIKRPTKQLSKKNNKPKEPETATGVAQRKAKGLGKSSNLISLDNEYLMAEKPQSKQVASCIRKACRKILSGTSLMSISHDSCDSFSELYSDFGYSSSSISNVRVTSSRSLPDIFDNVDSTDFELKNISAQRFIHEMAIDVLIATNQKDKPYFNFISNNNLGKRPTQVQSKRNNNKKKVEAAGGKRRK